MQVVIDEKTDEQSFSKEEAINNSIDTLKKSYEIVSKNIVLDETTKLNKMSPDGIKRVVEIYNSKHPNPNEHKKVSDYIA